MRVWEYKDKQGYKWLITKDGEKELIQQVVTFSRVLPDWEAIDEAQAEGRIKFVREYELKGVKNA